MRKKSLLVTCAILVVFLLSAAVSSAYAYHLFHAQGKSFDSNGVRINYFERGQGTPVVLVHGLGINAQANWMASGVFQHLARKYRVIAFDSRGHGLSDKPVDPKQYGAEMAEDVVRLMDNLKIEKAHVVGYSMGGFIVIKLIALHPERLLSAAPCGAGWAANPEKDLAFLDQLADDLDHGKGFERLLNFLQPVGKPPSKLAVAFTNAAMKTVNDVPAITASIRGMRDLRVSEAELRANKVPALAVIGEKDPLKAFADQLAGVTSNLEYVVTPKGDHMTTLRKPQTIAALDRFLAAHTTMETATRSDSDEVAAR